MAASKAHFTIQPTLGDGWLIEGTDANGVTNSKPLPYDESWDSYQAQLRMKAAVPAWDEAARAFYAPLLEKHAELFPSKDADPSVRVIEEGVAGKPRVACVLSPEGQLIEAITLGKFDSLRWVGDDLIALKG